MIWIALKMLTGDRSKYLAIIFGITFSCILIAEQSAMFCGIMMRTTSQIRDVHDADIWVMNPNVRFMDDLKAIADTAFLRVRGVPGVAWAVDFYRGGAQVQLEEGNYQGSMLFGVDDSTLVGAPQQMILGTIGNLQLPDAVLMDEAGYRLLWPDEPLRLGRTFEMNDRRARIVGIFKGSFTFATQPVIYTRFSQATQYIPQYRRSLTFVLTKCAAGESPETVAQRIQQQTGLKALTRDQFGWMTMMYYLAKTGIPVNFGTTVLLGFIVGCAIAGQTFYLFTVENLRQFGTLKAMGMRDGKIVRMIFIQALTVGSIGYCLGVGLATALGLFMQWMRPIMSFFLPWQVLALTAMAVLFIVLLSSWISVRRVRVLEPAVVFQA
ncbi:MAG TPA: ABC transporter permease [Pirellulales bacterium]|nr:ABC transporter permease [Pirellulales bacterium]